MQLFGTSGIRGLANRDLMTLALQVGLAVGSSYANVVVGRDTRTSGSTLRHIISGGILAAGARCSDAGIVPTPTLAYITREFDAGVMITASHNPPQYNGIKLLNPDGSAFSKKQQQQIEAMIEKGLPLARSWEKMQSGEVYATALEKHVKRIQADFPGGLKLKVVVDAGCGAAYFITPHLLTGLGCEVIGLNCYADGFFPHDVEPTEANLGELMRAVKETGSDIGIAHDGDADRMMAVDDKGRFISGDKMLTILAKASRSKTIVTTIDASMSIDEIGYEVKRTKVGDPYVSEELKNGAGWGGEPSGAWVFPKISLCPDGIYAAAQIVSISTQNKLSELADDIPAYPVIRSSIDGRVNMEELKKSLINELNPLSSDSIDGIKLNFKDGWLLVRPSGTEPKIRLTAEARRQSTLQKLHKTSDRIIRQNLLKETA
jgi:phosphoglucosamine mutase